MQDCLWTTNTQTQNQTLTYNREIVGMSAKGKIWKQSKNTWYTWGKGEMGWQLFIRRKCKPVMLNGIFKFWKKKIPMPASNSTPSKISLTKWRKLNPFLEHQHWECLWIVSQYKKCQWESFRATKYGPDGHGYLGRNEVGRNHNWKNIRLSSLHLEFASTGYYAVYRNIKAIYCLVCSKCQVQEKARMAQRSERENGSQSCVLFIQWNNIYMWVNIIWWEQVTD